MVEKLIFNLIAIGLFIVVFFIMAKKNDTNYLYLLFVEMIGITINFLEQVTPVFNSIGFKIIQYLFAIIIPVIILLLDRRNISFSEIIVCSKCYFIKDDKKKKEILATFTKKYSKSFNAHKMLEKLYEKSGEYEKALLEQYKILELNPGAVHETYKVAELLNKLNKPKEAEKVLRQIIRTTPQYVNSNRLLAQIMYSQQNYKEAARLINDALIKNPNDYTLYYDLGMVSIGLSDFQTAKYAYEEAAKLNTKLHNSFYTLGQIALASNDIIEAEKYFNKTIQYPELEAVSYYELAKISMIKNNKEGALEYIKKAINIKQDYHKVVLKEDVFNPIKQKISEIEEKEVIDKKESKREENLTELEKTTREKLNNTIAVVEKLSFKQREQYYQQGNLEIKNTSKKDIKERIENHEDIVQEETTPEIKKDEHIQDFRNI